MKSPHEFASRWTADEEAELKELRRRVEESLSRPGNTRVEMMRDSTRQTPDLWAEFVRRLEEEEEARLHVGFMGVRLVVTRPPSA